MDTNAQPPFFGPTQPNYPHLLQLLRLTGDTISGPAGGPVVLYDAYVQQLRDDTILPRDREACLVTDVSGMGLSVGYYLGRLASAYTSLPVYEVVGGCCAEHVKLTSTSVTNNVPSGAVTITPASMDGIFPGATLTSSGTVSTSSGDLSSGLITITPTSMAGIYDTQSLVITDVSNSETVTASSVTGTTFKATLSHSYTSPTITSLTPTTEVVTVTTAGTTTFTTTLTYPYAATWTLVAAGPPWPGIYALWDTPTGLFIAQANVWINPPNGEALATNTYYLAKLALLPLGGVPMYVTQQVSNGGGIVVESEPASTGNPWPQVVVNPTTTVAFPNGTITDSGGGVATYSPYELGVDDDASDLGSVFVGLILDISFPTGTVINNGLVGGVGPGNSASVEIPRIGSPVYNSPANLGVLCNGTNVGGDLLSNYTTFNYDGANLQVLLGSLVVSDPTNVGYFKVFTTGVGLSSQFSDGTYTVTFGAAAAGTGNAILVNSGILAVPGTSGNTVCWQNSVSAPTPQTVLSLPLSAFGSGTITQVLGTPDIWFLVKVGGSYYKVPGYS